MDSSSRRGDGPAVKEARESSTGHAGVTAAIRHGHGRELFTVEASFAGVFGDELERANEAGHQLELLIHIA